LNRVIKAFDPSQPRDEQGRWTGDGAHFEVTDAGRPAAVIAAAPTPEHTPELPEPEQSSHFLSATGDLATRLGSLAYDIGTLAYSANALRKPSTRAHVALHLGIIAGTVVALHTHITHLPEEAVTWWGEAHTALLHTKEALLKLKAKIFAARNADDVNKIARELIPLLTEVGAYA